MTKLGTLLVLIFVCLCSTTSFSQDDNPWWKKLFKKETVEEMEEQRKEEVIEPKTTPDTVIIDDSTINTAPVVERSPGTITIHTPLLLDSLNSWRVKDPIPTPGYRIQIYFGSLKSAKELRTSYMLKHPNDACYLVQSSPNFAVRIGDFRTSLEAHRFMESVRSEYPSAYIVPDQIAFPKIEDN